MPPYGSLPPHKRSFRNYLIDLRFQLKYTGYLVGLSLAISGVLGGFLWMQSKALVDESKKVSEISRMTAAELIGPDNSAFMSDYEKETNAHDGKLMKQQQTMRYALVGGLAAMVFLIGVLGIYITHKVAGPIYKIKRLLRQVAAGKLSFEGKLRKGDELQDVFEAFASMVDNLRKRHEESVRDLDHAIAMAKDAGATHESIAKLSLVCDQMKGRLQS